MSPPLFAARNVVFRYPEVTALDDLSMSIARGERVALLGANGSGKSTLLHLLDALYFAQRGEVLFEGRPLTDEALQEEAFAFDFRRRVGFILQNPDAQLFNPTVFDEVAFGPLQLRWPKVEIAGRVRSTLSQLGLAHLEDRAPHRLSGGEKKRVALASALILDPEVLLLDEPTAGLDPESQSRIIDFLVANEGHKTIIVATHDLGIVEDIADRCCVLESGRVTAEGPPARILRDEELLRRAHLLHAHRHRHQSGVVHSHSLLPGAQSHTHPRPG